MVYGQLFPKATDVETESLRRLGQRWKVCSLFSHLTRREFIRPIAIRERWEMGLRAASILVYWLHFLGDALRSTRFISSSLPFGFGDL